MKKFKPIMWLFLFGSIWGINEVFLGEILYRNDVQNSSVILTVMALFVLAVSRGMINKPGSSALMGTFAVLFRLANTAPSYCHLLGIFLLGATFDVFSSLLIKNKDHAPLRWGATGTLSAFGNNAIFALLITYVFRYEYWVAGGSSKVFHHIFISGSITTVIAVLLVPLGFVVGKNGSILFDRRPRWSSAGTVLGSIALWTVAKFLS
ncbi:MAG: hypothetical protein PVF66_03945 [Candidatus Aminicenantes bacterium]|jgi:hypothetical protein